ncbi:hypothetical protein BJX63DRAFT_411890 [Aspergillus granulosus]|uniref:BZIP domain-containing protein n=1 Tax=Aspergillus granulosus TaxID=176169 RepID=A0ABR4GWM9_9EURO
MATAHNDPSCRLGESNPDRASQAMLEKLISFSVKVDQSIPRISEDRRNSRSIIDYSAFPKPSCDTAVGEFEGDGPTSLTRRPVDPCSSTPSGTRTSEVPSATSILVSHDDKIKKRKEQNRKSQQAYRERKERLIQHLIVRVRDTEARHFALLESWQAQRQEIERLQGEIEDLKYAQKTFRYPFPASLEALASTAPVLSHLTKSDQNLRPSN